MTLPPDRLAAELSPPGIIVTGGPIADWQGPFDPTEDAAVAAAGPRRRAEFIAGRMAARAALARFGWPAVGLPRAADGPPVWPDGITGSISHGAGWCLAALCLTSTARAVGLDIEARHPLSAELIAEVCSPAELGLLVTEPDIGLAALRIFSAKEAAYKAQFMLSRASFGFDGIAVTLRPDGGFVATLMQDAGPIVAGTAWPGRQAAMGDLLISALVIA